MIDLGFLIALVASAIALWGVYQFNQQKRNSTSTEASRDERL